MRDDVAEKHRTAHAHANMNMNGSPGPNDTQDFALSLAGCLTCRHAWSQAGRHPMFYLFGHACYRAWSGLTGNVVQGSSQASSRCAAVNNAAPHEPRPPW